MFAKPIAPIVLITAIALFSTGPAGAEHATLPEVTVEAELNDHFSSSLFTPDSSAYTTPDAAAAITRIPGGSLNYNGQLSGQMQYRGMFGPRMNTRVDGMYINGGGPNWMDPPLHYLPGVLVDSIRVQRGIAPVRSGGGIGGYVDARTQSSRFSDLDTFSTHGELQTGGRSVDNGYDLGGILGMSNRNHRMHLLGSFEQGDDLESGDGDITGTEHRRAFGGIGYGYRDEVNEFAIDVRRVNSAPAGTPALPLDIQLFESNLFNSRFSTRIGNFDVEARINASSIDHAMNNSSLRPAPDISALPLPPFTGTDERFINAEGDGFGYALLAKTAVMQGTVRFGADGHLARNSATVGDPSFAPFFINNFNDAEVNSHGFFAEWERDKHGPWGVEAGLRVNIVNTDAGFVNAFPAVLADTGAVVNAVTTGAQTLRNNFNNADRSQSDTNLDAVLKIDYALTENVTAELGFARKVRSPTYIERYLWIPLEVNAGLGDGNNYIGDPNLDPETSHQVELGVNIQRATWYVTPRAWYRRVDDYIQGTASTNAAAVTFSALAAGDATPLVFSNVDAELYGFDTDAGYAFNRHWRLDATVSYTRGKRRDIDDSLYRIAPLNGRLGLTHGRADWSVTLEGVAFAEQHDISDTITLDPANPNNNNESTPGYALLNLYGQYRFAGTGFKIQAGMENALDEEYTDHLSGFNRNSASDVAVGRRLPGPGRNLFATLAYSW